MIRFRSVVAGLAIVLAAALDGLPIAAQDPPQKPAQSSTSYLIDRWNTEAGLPQNSVNGIMQSRDGRLWLATLGGIASFDGTAFTPITTGDRSGLRSDRAHALAEDRDGRIWIGTEGGLSRYDHGSITTFTTAQGLPSDFVRAVAAHPDGSIWFGTHDGALGRVSGDAVQVIVPARGQFGEPVADLGVDGQGAVWASADTGIWRLEPTTRTPALIYARTKAGRDLPLLSLDPGGGVWFATSTGAVLHAREGTRAISIAPVAGFEVGEIRLVTSDGGGGLWLGTKGDVWHYRPGDDPVHDSLERVNVSVPGPLTSLVRDRESSVWVGNRITGLVRVRPSLFQVYTAADGLSQDNSTAVFRDSGGRIWMGGQCGGAALLEAGRIRKLAERETPGCVWTFAEDGNGDIWMGGRGTGRWRDGTFTMVDPAPGIRVLFKDREGTMWVGGPHGLQSWNGTAFVPRLGRDRVTRPDVRTMYEAPDAALWIGMEGGLLRYASGVFQNVTQADGRPYTDVRAIYQDGDGTVWLGTYGAGLIRVRDGTSTSIQTTDGLPDNFLSSIVEDKSGNLWLSSDRGVFRVARRELDEFAAGRVTGVHSIAYGRADGMLSAETNGGFTPAVGRMPDGRLWSPTLVGVAIIDPSAAVSSVAPTIALDGILVNGRPLSQTGEISIGPGADDVEIRYSGLYLSAPNAVTFQYQLESWDRGWVDAGTRRSVNYSHLSPGQYRFRVSAANRDGVRSNEATLALTVLPRFWQTWWFRSLAVLALAAVPILGHIGHRRRQAELTRLVDQKTHELSEQKSEIEQQARELQKQNEILAENVRLKDDVERISRHDLRTPLASIISLAQIVRDGGDLPPQHDASLKLIEQTGYRAMNLANLSLDLFKMEQGTYRLSPTAVDLRAVIDRVISDLQPVLRTRQVTCEVKTAAPGTHFVRADELLSYSMLSNLIKNAAESSPGGGRVTVSLGREAGSIRVRIHNVGAIPERLRERFFDKYATADKKGGTGLGAYSARLMAETQGGTIHVSTSGEEGTTITIVLAASDAPAPVSDPKWAEASAVVSQPGGDRPSRTLLVVDDDDNNRLILRRFLAHPRWIVDEAENGPVALKKITERSYDVVFLDVEMPVMDGPEVAARIRAAGLQRRPLVVGLSSHDDPETKILALKSGCDQYFTKPVSRQTVVDVVLGAAVADAVALAAIDPDVLALLPAFLSKQQEEIAHLETAIAAGDAEAVRRIAHRMRGSAAMYRLAEAAAICAELEEMGRSNQLRDAAKRVPALMAIYRKASI